MIQDNTWVKRQKTKDKTKEKDWNETTEKKHLLEEKTIFVILFCGFKFQNNNWKRLKIIRVCPSLLMFIFVDGTLNVICSSVHSCYWILHFSKKSNFSKKKIISFQRKNIIDNSMTMKLMKNNQVNRKCLFDNSLMHPVVVWCTWKLRNNKTTKKLVVFSWLAASKPTSTSNIHIQHPTSNIQYFGLDCLCRIKHTPKSNSNYF